MSLKKSVCLFIFLCAKAQAFWCCEECGLSPYPDGHHEEANFYEQYLHTEDEMYQSSSPQTEQTTVNPALLNSPPLVYPSSQYLPLYFQHHPQLSMDTYRFPLSEEIFEAENKIYDNVSSDGHEVASCMSESLVKEDKKDEENNVVAPETDIILDANKRPPNKFFLYMEDQQSDPALKGMRAQDRVTLLSQRWKKEPKKVKEEYTKKQKIIADKHKMQFPDYKYCPKTKGDRKKRIIKSK